VGIIVALPVIQLSQAVAYLALSGQPIATPGPA
jgi:hypothetical protein